MTTTVRCASGAIVALALSACMVSTGEEVDTTGLSEDEAISSVQQALVTPTFTGRWASTNSVTCPSSYNKVMGTGARNISGGGDLVRGAYPFSNETVNAMAAIGDTTEISTYAICTNAAGISTVWNYDSDGSATASCGSGKIAVGGGGLCQSDGARLYRTRPTPDTNGSVPTGWTASCNTGGAHAYARCVDPNSWYDFTSCRTKRTDAVAVRADAVCPSGKIAAAAGGYCGGGSDIWTVGSGSGAALSSTVVWCDETHVSVHAYAICCDAAATN